MFGRVHRFSGWILFKKSWAHKEINTNKAHLEVIALAKEALEIFQKVYDKTKWNIRFIQCYYRIGKFKIQFQIFEFSFILYFRQIIRLFEQSFSGFRMATPRV